MVEIKKFSPLNHKLKATIYGASGTGKTTFGASGGEKNKTIFASAEAGLLSTASSGRSVHYSEIKSLQDLYDLHDYLEKNPNEYDVLVVDSITEINEIIKNGIVEKMGRTMQIQDWGTLGADIMKILRKLRDLPMHTIVLAHEASEKDGENGETTKMVPSLNGKAQAQIAYIMDVVGYSYVTKDGEHKITTKTSPRLVTKDRTKLISDDTTPSLEVWIEKLKSIKVSGAEEVVAKHVTPKVVVEAQKKSQSAEAIAAKLTGDL